MSSFQTVVSLFSLIILIPIVLYWERFFKNADQNCQYRWPSPILTIHIEIWWNLIPYLCSKPGLVIRGFAIHIHKILEHNPRAWETCNMVTSKFPSFSLLNMLIGQSLRTANQPRSVSIQILGGPIALRWIVCLSNFRIYS